MKVFICPKPGEDGKFQAIVKAFPSIWFGSILDVGCRSGRFKDVLPKKNVRYCGLDLSLPANIIGDLEKGLAFKDKAFDVVVALDVLEHTDKIWNAFGELCRVARQYCVITLPNCYELKSRISFLFGLRLSGKYGLPTEPPPDRHKWLFSFQEAMTFVHTLGQKNGFKVADEGCLVGPRLGSIVGRWMVSKFPNLLSKWYLALLVRVKE